MNATRVVIADYPAVVRDGIAHKLRDLPNFVVYAEAEVGPSLFATFAQSQVDCLLLGVVMPWCCLRRHASGK